MMSCSAAVCLNYLAIVLWPSERMTSLVLLTLHGWRSQTDLPAMGHVFLWAVTASGALPSTTIPTHTSQADCWGGLTSAVEAAVGRAEQLSRSGDQCILSLVTIPCTSLEEHHYLCKKQWRSEPWRVCLR